MKRPKIIADETDYQILKIISSKQSYWYNRSCNLKHGSLKVISASTLDQYNPKRDISPTNELMYRLNCSHRILILHIKRLLKYNFIRRLRQHDNKKYLYFVLTMAGTNLTKALDITPDLELKKIRGSVK
jgi:DNA-binding HxlR family transcriptional regulator